MPLPVPYSRLGRTPVLHHLSVVAAAAPSAAGAAALLAAAPEAVPDRAEPVAGGIFLLVSLFTI